MRGEARGDCEVVRRIDAEGRREVRREAVEGRGAGLISGMGLGRVGVTVAGRAGEGERF